MSEELKPCPFCGGSAKAHIYKDDFEATRFSVECVSCPAEMGWMVDAQPWGENLAMKKAETIAAWNHRAPSPDMREVVEAATKLVSQWEAFEAGYGNQEEAYYKLAKYARPHWEALRAALRSLTGVKP